jgi:hypothetical protein
MHLGTRLPGEENTLKHRFEAGDGFDEKCKSAMFEGNVEQLT